MAFCCAAFCMMSFASATNPPAGKGHKTPVVDKAVTETTKSTTEEKKTTPPDLNLLADNIRLKDKKRVQELKETLYGNTAEELNYPAVDVYGEDSWNDRVNPFIGFKDVHIPDTFSIDCSQFSYPLTEITRVNSRYGYRKRFRRMHYGIDLKITIGDTIRAAFDGKIRLVEFERKGYGNYVVMRHPNGLETVYGHLSKHLVKPDQIVKAGEAIGLAGNTGRSTGPHLHFETRFMGIPINPELIIDFDNGVPLSEQYVFVKQNHPYKASSKVASSKKGATSRNTGIAIHRVRKGDTLAVIASKYGTTVSKICKLNGISTRTTLKVGRSLRVSS